MKKILIIICFIILIFLLLKSLRDYTILHPIKMTHPCPTLTRRFPILKWIDEYTAATAGILWLQAKDKNNRTYLIVLSTDWGKYEQKIEIMDYLKRDKWHKISRNEFIKRFGKDAEGELYNRD